MAVQMMSTIQRWEGLSTDVKPAAPTFVGSTFYETDTGRTYLWNGVAWVVMPVHILNVQGGAYTIQDLMEEHLAHLDLARSPQSGTYTFVGAALVTIYEQADDHPWIFYGGYIDWTGCNFGAGENTTVNLDMIIAPGGAYRNVWTHVYLAAALPVPILQRIPHIEDAAGHSAASGPLENVYGVRVQVSQAAIGGGWNTIDHEWFDEVRGG